MRVLIISGFFPPNAPTATVRVPRFAKFLLENGHDVRVLSALDLQFPTVQSPNIPEEFVSRVVYSRGGSPKPSQIASKSETPNRGEANQRKVRGLRRTLWDLQTLPDPHVRWIKPAIKSGLSLIDEFDPQVMFSSGPPHSGHVVAERLLKLKRVPYVAELRDLWSDDLYRRRNIVVRTLDRYLERSALKRAAAIITTTNGAAELIARRYRVPAIAAANGFDPQDFHDLPDSTANERKVSDPFTILHAGSTYGGRRSPEPLFQALVMLESDIRRRIKVQFFGEDHRVTAACAERYSLGDIVQTAPPIRHSEVIRREKAADLLLLLRFPNAGEQYVVPGKLYEYIGARRPILCVGKIGGEVTNLLNSLSLGLGSNDANEIARWLTKLVSQKASAGLDDLPVEPTLTFARNIQYAKIEAVLKSVACPAGLSDQGRRLSFSSGSSGDRWASR